MSSPSLIQVVAEKRAVIFDLFHTLTALESTWGGNRMLTHEMLGVSKQAWDEQLHEHSMERLTGAKPDPFAIIRDMARAVDPTIPEHLIRRATDNRIARFAAAIAQLPSENRSVIRSLKETGKRIGLISNADVMEMAAWSECPIRDLFDSTIFSCQIGSAKPEPAIYHRCLKELGVSAAEAVFVGDGGSHELEGAKAVGLTTIMVTGIIREIWPERIPERQKHADFVVEGLTELLS